MEPLLMETEYEKPLVLVVDDDPTNLRILVSKLNREYRLGVAKSGTKALEYMGKQIPDLVLLDVMMPDMDGYAVCEHIKRDPRLCDIPVVFISYVDDPSQKTRGFEVGGVDYITKPFHDAEVLARVRTHIMNKQMREQLKRHNAEIGKELDEHRRQLLALLDNLPGLAYRETVIGGIPDARRAVSFVSDGVLGLTGYAPDRFMGEERLGLLDIAHEEDRETIRSAIATALKEHRRWELVYRIITAWGEEKWVWEQSSGAFDASGTLITIEGLVNDITEKQKNELGIRRENEELRERLKARCFNNIVGDSPPMREVFELIARAGATEDCVVVFGESGTGKELAARAVHECSARCDKPFIAVNCGAIPENLFESEFFGYKKGAFTGALADRKGCLDRADGGTLFLDELGELSLSAQTKLLRAIEGQGFTPVGGSDLHKPNFRIIAATNRNLAERVASGQMREDFFYRIHVIPIHLPPLRQRKEDIPLLIEYFLNAYPRVGDLPALNGEVMQAFMQYDWPGNIRELHNTLYSLAHCRSARGSFPQGDRQAPARPNTARPCRRNRWPRRWTASSGNTCSKRSAATTGSGRKRRISSASTAAPCSARSSSSIWRTKRANSPVQETPRPGIPPTRKLLGKGTDPIRPAGLGNKRKSPSPKASAWCRGIRLPHAKRAARQRGIGIPAVARHLFPNPAGPLKGLPLVGKFDFSDDKPRVVPEELVDFPDKALIGDFIADFVDEGWQRQRVEHPVGVPARDLVLELLAGKAPCLPFDGQNAAFAFRTHADRARVCLQVALPEPHAFGEPAPCLAFDKKFSLDFHVHVILPYGPMPYASPLPRFGPGVQAGRFPPETPSVCGTFSGLRVHGEHPASLSVWECVFTAACVTRRNGVQIPIPSLLTRPFFRPALPVSSGQSP